MEETYLEEQLDLEAEADKIQAKKQEILDEQELLRAFEMMFEDIV